LLGDTFLRSAYVVYDLDNNEIAMAQANLNSTDTNVQELTESSNLSLFEGVEQQQGSSGTGGGGNSNTNSGPPGGSSGTLSVSGITSSSTFVSSSASATSVGSRTLGNTNAGLSAGTVSTGGVAAATGTGTGARVSSGAGPAPSSYPDALASVNKAVPSSSSEVQPVPATFTDDLVASSSANAGTLVATSGHGAVYTAGLAAFLAISGSALF
jgi:hypothetical protein